MCSQNSFSHLMQMWCFHIFALDIFTILRSRRNLLAVGVFSGSIGITGPMFHPHGWFHHVNSVKIYRNVRCFSCQTWGENHGFPVNSPTSSLLSKSHAGWQRKGVDGQTVASHAGWDTTCQVQHLRNTGISPINNVYIGGVSHFVNGLYPQVYIYIPTYMWDYRGYMWIINDPKWDAHPSSSVVVEYSCWLVISTFYISFLSLLWCFNSLS